MSERFFNTAGPVNTRDHYVLPPLARVDLPHLESLIRQKKYFVLHAPRQTGKTSALLALRDHLNASGAYRCVYANLEVGQAARERIELAEGALCDELAERYGALFPLPPEITAQTAASSPTRRLNALLSHLSAVESERPLIVLFDEIDSLVGDTLISVLRQIRAGYDRRPEAFPQSLVLCGVRDVRDYRMHTDVGKAPVTGGSAFNIKAESLTVGNFSQAEVCSLMQQHVDATGQPFTGGAMTALFRLTQGQPWLVNALAYEIAWNMPEGRDRATVICEALVQEAKERLILRRDTHLDQLADKLRDPRVRSVIEPILEGSGDIERVATDDVQYVENLGLIRSKPQLAIANPIYQEIIPRELLYSEERTITHQQAWYLDEQNNLLMDKLLTAFQTFFREQSESWMEGFDYKEAGPQLLMQAFLQRIVNGGGRIEREYALGRKRTDLLVLWPAPKPGVPARQRIVVELKLRHAKHALETVVAEGLRQTADYADSADATEAHLIVFDRKPGVPWDNRIYRRQESINNRTIQLWGL